MTTDPSLIQKELGYLIAYLIISILVLGLYLWISKKARKEWLILIGQLKPRIAYEWERRQYIRLGVVFPVEFQKMDEDKLGPMHEAFTKDVSQNGVQIEVKTLHGKRLESIIPDQTKLKLIINMPIFSEPVEAVGLVKWIQKLEGIPLDRYVMGVSYETIKRDDASRIIKYSLWLYRKPLFIGSIMVVFILIITMLFAFLSDLRITRRRLQKKIEAISQEKKVLVDRLKEIELEKTRLNSEMQRILESERRLRTSLSLMEKEKLEEKKRSLELELELEAIVKEKEDLQKNIDGLEEELFAAEEFYREELYSEPETEEVEEVEETEEEEESVETPESETETPSEE